MKKNLKILFVAHSGEISGGANRSLLSMMQGLRDRYGIEPSALIPERNSALEAECARLGIAVYTGKYHRCCTVLKGEPKDALRLMKLAAAPIIDRIGARKLSRSLPGDFDLIYTNERMTIIGGYLAKRLHIPHVWHVRSFGRENATLFSPCWYARMSRFSDRIVLISRALYRDFGRHISPEKLRVVYNGLEPWKYMQEERHADGAKCRGSRPEAVGAPGEAAPLCDIRSEKDVCGSAAGGDGGHGAHGGMGTAGSRGDRPFRILVTGRITTYKCQADAVRALEQLVRRHGVDARLLFAGQMPSYETDSYGQKLQRYVNDHGLQENVQFLGEVDCADLLRIRSGIDVEAVCSQCEPFGRVTVEAMMAGLPVVGTNAGGTAEIIEDRVTGFLYPIHDVDALTRHLLWLYEHPRDAAVMGQKGQERAMACFTVEMMVDHVYGVINEIV